MSLKGMPMISNDLRSSCRALLLQGGGGGGEPEKKWEYPKEWLPLPDPQENEVYMLIMFNKSSGANSEIEIAVKPDANSSLDIDWGDGEVYSGNGFGSLKHSYTWGRGTQLSENVEMYLVKVSVSGLIRFHFFSGDNGSACAAISLGGSSFEDANETFVQGSPNILEYIRFTGDPTNWENCLYVSGFSDCYALARVDFDFTRKVKKLPPYSFYSNHSLTYPNLPDLSEVTECGKNCFSSLYGLTKLSLPKLKTAGNDCFCYSYNMLEIDLPQLVSVGMESSQGWSTFSGYYCIHKISLPSLEKLYSSCCFQNCYGLEILDLPKLSVCTSNVNNIGSSSQVLRHLNAPNIDTTGWFKNSIYMQ